MLNNVFSKFSPSWQSLSELQVTTLDDTTDLFLRSTYGFIPLSKSGFLPLLKSGPELPQVPVVSRYFVAYLTSFVAAAVAPFFRTKDQRVASRTNKFFDKSPHTLAVVQDKDLSVYLNRKATAWYVRFPPVHGQDRINDTKKVRDAEGPEEEDASDVDDAAYRAPLSDDEDEESLRMSPTEGARNEARFAQLFLQL